MPTAAMVLAVVRHNIRMYMWCVIAGTCVFVALNFIVLMKDAHGDIASVEYVDKIVLQLQPNNNVQPDWNQTDTSAPNYILNKPDLLVYDDHIQSAQNPHNVTKRQIGLANVQDVDTTNADNITSGTVAVGRLPVGTQSGTVAAGDDARFVAVSTSVPAGAPPSGYVWLYFNE